MDLQTEIAAINAAPISQDQKDSIITKLILDAAAMAPAAATPDALALAAQKANQAANKTALANTVPSALGGPGAQTPQAQASAAAYTPVPPAPNDGSLDANGRVVDPLRWAYREFVAAGYANVDGANGPLQRWSGQGLIPGDPSTWIPAFNAVVAGYAAGTANMAGGTSSTPTASSINAGNYTPDSYTDQQKMAMQYVHSGGPGSAQARMWLDKQLGGDGVSQNQKYLALDQMFGSSGTATLYNPLAGQAMNQLLAGSTPVNVQASLEAQNTGTAGYNESLAQITPAWFALAQATITQFKS